MFYEGRGHCHEEVGREWLAGLALQVLRTLLLTPRIPRAVENHATTGHSSSKMLAHRLGPKRRHKIQALVFIIYGLCTFEFVYLLTFLCNRN